MPQFALGALKTARASITIAPSGLSCQAELYLVSGATKVATSGLIPFTSTGAAQDSAFPITMPSATGTYKVYLDVFASGVLIGAYVATEDVTIAAPVASLYGVVVDSQTGYALQGVKVTLDSLVAYTDSSGYYSFTGLSVGAHTVKFEKTGYETLTR